MKLHRLELEGFGPFRARQAVDFDAFDADGLFLISGRTGSGKSSILDGVCFALYGTAPRYDGSDRGLRSDHVDPSEPTEASLEFTAGGERWRVTRTPQYDRPKAYGAGTTTQKSTVLVEQRVGDAWIGRTTKHREAGDLLGEVVGLTREQFQQVILLAQNKFAEFLLASNDDRQALLRTLFGSRKYEEYEKAFDDRRRTAQQALEAAAAAVEAHVRHAERIVDDHALGGATPAGQGMGKDAAGPASAATPPTATPPAATPPAAATASAHTTGSRLASVESAVPRARYRADESARRRDEARAAHDDALTAFGARTALRSKQEARLVSRRTFDALEARAPEIAADRVRLDRARSAEVLRAPIASAARARTLAGDAAEAEQLARTAWAASSAPDAPDADVAALRTIADAIAGDLAVWAVAAEHERELPGLEAARDRAEAAVVTLEAELAGLAQTSAMRVQRIAGLDPELEAAAHAAAPVGPAREAVEVAAQRLTAGRDAERLAAVARTAEAAHLTAAADLELATTAVRELLQRRLDGYAGELASALVDGRSCAVCGSIEHPNPAPGADDPVTDDDVAAAEAGVAAANRIATDASEDARRARAAHQEAAVRAGGETVARLEVSLVEAETHLEAAVASAAAMAGLKHELAELRAAESTAATERSDLEIRLATAREDRVATAQHARTATAAVDAARGDCASVSERVAEARRRRDLARALADSVDEAARREAAAVAAENDRDERLAGSAFAQAAEASAALLAPDAQSALADAVRAYEVAYETERERLLALETELAGEPEELVDLAESAAVAEAARTAWNAAVETAARDGEIAAQLADAVAAAQTVHSASADSAAEHEIIAGLANAVSGRTDSRMDLETFVLAAELEEIVAAANMRLDSMSSGRYLLQHTDEVALRRKASGLGLSVLDAYTGQSRHPQSLSGGETFLASLALALGLAEVVSARAGGVHLDTLFIDEGFGSLDDETLTLAMTTLDELRQGGRTVGLISHVAAMKEQLPAQLVVESTPQGPSIIRQASPVVV